MYRCLNTNMLIFRQSLLEDIHGTAFDCLREMWQKWFDQELRQWAWRRSSFLTSTRVSQASFCSLSAWTLDYSQSADKTFRFSSKVANNVLKCTSILSDPPGKTTATTISYRTDGDSFWMMSCCWTKSVDSSVFPPRDTTSQSDKFHFGSDGEEKCWGEVCSAASGATSSGL